MNTQQLVSLIKEDFAPSYSRTRILSYIERAQNELFNHDCAQTKFINKNDDSFPVPILSTTAGTLKYVLSESNLVDSDGNAIDLAVNGYDITIRRIARVFVNVATLTTPYDNIFIGREFDWAGINSNWSRKLYDIRYQEVPVILYDYSPVEGAHLVFVEDPGTYDDKYYVEFYYFPVSLDSEQIPLTVDPNKWTEAIIKAVRGYIEESRNGRSELLDASAAYGSFRNYWIPKFRNNSNFGTEKKTPFVFDTRDCL